ncbi:MAG: antitoxin family protein [Chloroflexi bacterium]|nr:antitoxin family protein [Chloroflexota bacterium]
MPHRTIRARYANGVLNPLEPLDLSEGCEVTVDVTVDHDSSSAAAPKHADKPRILEIIDEVQREFPNAFAGMPHDGATQYKHYLYGHPKDGD